MMTASDDSIVNGLMFCWIEYLSVFVGILFLFYILLGNMSWTKSSQ